MSLRRQILGRAAIESALERGEPLRQIFVRRERENAGVAELLRRARTAGIAVHVLGPRHFWRLRRNGGEADVFALVGPAPDASMEEVLRGDGATWHLVGVAYPGNAGMAIRTAEVSGAAGVFLDVDFDHAARRAALRASMRADRFMPVFFASTPDVLARAEEAERRLIAVEDVGDASPWDLDLGGRVHFIVGGEARGIPEPTLARCHAAIRVPMSGFVPSYNLQAAVAAVASERLRQLEGKRG